MDEPFQHMPRSVGLREGGADRVLAAVRKGRVGRPRLPHLHAGAHPGRGSRRPTIFSSQLGRGFGTGLYRAVIPAIKSEVGPIHLLV